MDFTADSTVVADWVVVHVSGEVDVYSAPVLRARLDANIREGHHRLVVDLSGVTFMDSTGLGVLVGRLKLTRVRQGTIVLAGVRDRVAKVFNLTGLDKVFAIYDNVEAAIDGAG